MKSFFITLALTFSGAVLHLVGQEKSPSQTINPSKQQEERRKGAEACVHSFIAAGDNRNQLELEKLIHPNFRVLAKLPTATGVIPVIEGKAQYLSMINEGKLGGKPRSIKSLRVEIWNSTAIVRVEMESSELQFSSTFSLFYSAETGWQIVHDLVELQAR